MNKQLLTSVLSGFMLSLMGEVECMCINPLEKSMSGKSNYANNVLAN